MRVRHCTVHLRNHHAHGVDIDTYSVVLIARTLSSTMNGWMIYVSAGSDTDTGLMWSGRCERKARKKCKVSVPFGCEIRDEGCSVTEKRSFATEGAWSIENVNCNWLEGTFFSQESADNSMTVQ